MQRHFKLHIQSLNLEIWSINVKQVSKPIS